jgi:hypothetical protein
MKEIVNVSSSDILDEEQEKWGDERSITKMKIADLF